MQTRWQPPPEYRLATSSCRPARSRRRPPPACGDCLPLPHRASRCWSPCRERAPTSCWRWSEMPQPGSEYAGALSLLALGAMLGPAGLGVLTPQLLTLIDPAVPVGLTALGVLSALDAAPPTLLPW